jgi:uncharacterized membrane protein YqaE (UPF0057 family)
MCGTDCFLMLLSVLFPPIGVWVKRGICSADSIINIALCCLGVLPGLIHAWYIILKYPDPYTYEAVQHNERGDGTVAAYYVVTSRGPVPANVGYGTVSSQPSAGQFPGQQSGTTNAFPGPKPKPTGVTGSGPAGADQGAGGSSRPAENPPTYAEVIKGDHKVQKP